MDTRENRGFYILLILLTAAAGAGVLLLYVLQMTGSGTEQNRFTPPEVSRRVVRGSIYDAGGRLLALEVPVYDASVWTPSITDEQLLARVASNYLDMDEEQILSRISQREGFIYLQRGISYETAQRLREDISRSGLQGLSLEKHYGRLYPYHEMAAQTIGYVDIDNYGTAGIEYYYEDQLAPLAQPGKESTYGNDLVLTLQVPFQTMLDGALRNILEDHQADGVSGVIMDGSTGDILAVGSYPSFDPNDPGSSSHEQRIHRAVGSMYEPGSVFKVFSLAALLEILGSSHEPFYCRGVHQHALEGGSSITIRCTRDHGVVETGDIIKYSCNNAIAHLALQADDREFYEKLLEFGFSRRTGAGLPGESPGLLLPPESWSARSKPTIAFGQESGMTALQAAAAATALTNNGVMLQPHIIREITAPDGTQVYQREVTEGAQVLSSENASLLKAFMETAAAPGGTGFRMHTPGLALGAKTGTAQLPDPETGGYSAERYLASSIALMPGKDTTYIIYIAADYPKAGSIYGSYVVVPYIKEIVDRAVREGYVTIEQQR